MKNKDKEQIINQLKQLKKTNEYLLEEMNENPIFHKQQPNINSKAHFNKKVHK